MKSEKYKKSKKFKKRYIKSYISVFMVFITVFCTISYQLCANAQTMTEDDLIRAGDFGIKIYENGKTCNIFKYYGNEKNLVVPKYINYNEKDYKVCVVSLDYIKSKTIKYYEKPPTTSCYYVPIKSCLNLEYILNTNCICRLFNRENPLYPNDKKDYTVSNCPNIKEIYFPNIWIPSAINIFNSGIALESIYFGDIYHGTGEYATFPNLYNDTNLSKVKAYIPQYFTKIKAAPEKFDKIYGQTGSYAEEFANENGIEFVPVNPYIRGDFNYDGEVNIADVTETQRYLAGLSTIDHVDEQVAYWHGNFDADNHFDVKDVTYLQKYLVEYLLYLDGTEKYVNGVRQ